ncbi:MAG: type IV secretion system DNA-binding domain-containing protein, partial [Sulfurimonas sp.]|nr:type IV secretion system DNA-binding domain-containing protein [Sulfurimonas sp.]
IVGAVAKIDEAYETMHGIIIGSSGTGKSVFLKRLYLWQKKNRPNGKWVIHDVKGDWVSSFYNPTNDFIFNFSDTRSINFNVFSIIKSVNDIKSVVATIIPRNPNEKEPIWTDSGRDILEGCFYYCIANNQKTNQHMKQLMLLSHKDLAEKLSTIKGAEIAFGHLSSSPTQAGNFMSNFRSKAAFFSSIPDTKIEQEINIEEWINQQGQSTIFLYNNTKDKDLNASRISIFVDSTVKTLLSMGESKSRRVYFLLDEFGSLNKMDSIVDGLALLRSFGGSIWIGIQEVQRIYSIYGKDLTSTIVNNTATKVILRSQEVETLEFSSKLIGKQEIEQTNMNASIGTKSNRDGVSYNKAIKEKTTILASEIAQLANNEFYFKNGDYNWTHIKTEFIQERDLYPIINKHLIERSDLLLKNINYKKLSEFQGNKDSLNNIANIVLEESVGW